MRYAIQSPTPTCPRLLVQDDTDADGIGLALAVGEAWARGRLLLVVNGSGRDLSGYAARGHRFSVLLDDQGRPSRSLGEIAEAFEGIDPDEIGCVVVVDTNRIYRATRCAVRDVRKIRDLSSGDWDETNESLGSAGEALTRAGIPSVFLAPSTDERGLDVDGQEVTIGTKPQAWKGLERSSHVQLHARAVRRGGIEVKVLGDDHRVLGRIGDVIDATDPTAVASKLAPLAKDCRPTIATTTLAESTATELAARRRREERGIRASAARRDRIVALANVRAHQGAIALFELERELDVGDMLTSDREFAAQAISKASAMIGRGRGPGRGDWAWWIDSMESTMEQSSATVRTFGAVSGPDPKHCPSKGLTHGQLRGLLSDLENFGHWAMECDDAQLFGAIASLARLADLWSEPRFAVLCMACGLAKQGRDWDIYPREMLVGLATTLAGMAAAVAMYDPPPQRDPNREGDQASAEPSLAATVSRKENSPSPDVPGSVGQGRGDRHGAQREAATGNSWPSETLIGAGPAHSEGLPAGEVIEDEDGVIVGGIIDAEREQEVWDQTLELAGAPAPRLVHPPSAFVAESLASDPAPSTRRTWPRAVVASRTIGLPAPRELLTMSAETAASYVLVALDQAAIDIDDAAASCNVQTGRRREPVTWAPAEREAVYGLALGRLLQRAA